VEPFLAAPDTTAAAATGSKLICTSMDRINRIQREMKKMDTQFLTPTKQR
jgi:hypothetical protein